MRSIWSKFKLEIIAFIALICVVILRGYITHPGVHVAGALFILDVIVLRMFRRQFPIWRMSWLCVLNIIGFLEIAFCSDLIELGMVGVLGLLLIGILLFGYDERTR